MIVCPIFQFLVLPYYISLITILSFVFTDFIHDGEAGHKEDEHLWEETVETSTASCSSTKPLREHRSIDFPAASCTWPVYLPAFPCTWPVYLPASPAPGPSTPSSASQPVEHDVVCYASKRKLGYCFNNEDNKQEIARLPSTITDPEMLKPLFSNLRCPNLKGRQPSLSLENTKSKNCGLAISLVVLCTTCGDEISSAMTSAKCAICV